MKQEICERAEQLKTVKAVLKALKVQFEPQSGTLPSYVIKGIEKSLQQHEAGQTISLQFTPEAVETYDAVVSQLRQR